LLPETTNTKHDQLWRRDTLVFFGLRSTTNDETTKLVLGGQLSLIGGIHTPLKNDGVRQLGVFFPIYGKIKHVPNHQPDQIHVVLVMSSGPSLMALIGSVCEGSFLRRKREICRICCVLHS